MNPRFFKYFFLLISFIIFSQSFAQNNKINNTTQLWSEADMLGNINKKWKWQCDFRYITQSPFESLAFYTYGKQVMIRPSIHYSPKPNIKLSLIVGEFYNYAIAETGAREYPEYRGTLQAQFYKEFGLNKIYNRFRTELRDIKDNEGTFEQVFRGRYMFRYQRLLRHEIYDKNSIYFSTYEEVFFNGGSPVTGYKTLDQNRIFVGIGYYLTTNIFFETGYFNQYAYHAHDANFDSNHIWQVTLIFDNLTKGRVGKN